MKKTLIALVTIAAIGLTSWGVVRSQQMDAAAQSVDESQVIVAEYDWDGKPYQISLADLNAAIAELAVYRQENYQTREGKGEYLKEFLEEKLKFLAATKNGLDKNEEFLKKAEDYKHQLMVEQLTKIEIDEKVAYTEDDLRQYYEEHKEEYVEKEQVRPFCISLIDEDRAYEVLELIKGGKDMVEMAKELSENEELDGPGSYDKENPGDLGSLTREVSAAWKDFIDAVFELEVGEMTQEVFEIDVSDETYYLIFRKEEHKPERQKELEEVKDRIESRVEREKKRQRIEEWVETVTTQGQLKTYPDRIPEPPSEEEAPEEEEADASEEEVDALEEEEVEGSEEETEGEKSEGK